MTNVTIRRKVTGEVVFSEIISGAKSTPEARGQAILSALQKGVRLAFCDLTNSNLENLDISGNDLTACDFSFSNLSGCNMESCKLTSCNFTSCNMQRCNIRNCDMSMSNLRQCDLSNSLLLDTNMKSSNVRLCNLSGCNLGEAYIARCHGANDYIKMLSLGGYEIVYTDSEVYISCFKMPMDKMKNMDTKFMLENGGRNGVRAWKRWGEFLQRFISDCPALSSGQRRKKIPNRMV